MARPRRKSLVCFGAQEPTSVEGLKCVNWRHSVANATPGQANGRHSMCSAVARESSVFGTLGQTYELFRLAAALF